MHGKYSVLWLFGAVFVAYQQRITWIAYFFVKYLLLIFNIACIVHPHEVQVVLLFSGSIFWFYRYFSPS